MGSFGDKLRRERQMRNITLEEIAASTRIGTRFLQALENEQFEKLPGGIFNKGFVRSYARYLGIDEDQAVTDFLAVAGETESSLPEPPSAARPSVSSGGRAWRIALAGLVVLVLAIAAWSYFSGKAGASTQRASQEHPEEPAAQPAVLEQTAARPLPPETTPSTRKDFQLSVRAIQDSWVSLKVDGEPSFEAVLEASKEHSVRAHKEVVVTLGNAGGVEISHNGHLVPPVGAPGTVRTVTFTAEGMQQ